MELAEIVEPQAAENTELRQRIRKTEEKLTELEKLIRQTLEDS